MSDPVSTAAPRPSPPLADWIGRTEQAHDLLTPRQVHSLRAVLDLPHDPHAAPPPLSHWLLAPPIAAESGLGDDGHPQRGGFLPPVALPRRMWAAGSVTFLRPLPVGQPLQRHSRIAAITAKPGRSGALLFVDLHHRWLDAQAQPLIDETQRLVYRGPAQPGDAPAAEHDAAMAGAPWQRDLQPTPTLLMRYSALTFNSHRIHYDLPYARDVEGYPALVVHGPLTATLLADLCQRHLGPHEALSHFDFRGTAPACIDRPLHLRGRRDGTTLHLCALDDTHRVLMRAQARIGTTPP